MQQSSKARTIQLLSASVLMGLSVGLLYLGFEWVVNQGTNFIWNTLAQSDIYRWRVIPLAIILGIVYSASLRQAKKVRLVPIDTNLSDEIADQSENTTLIDVAIILGIGAMSLLAGASLGPEAPLVAASIALAAWAASKLKIAGTPQAKLLAVTSLGALLCAFFHTLIPMVIPLLLLAKKKQLKAGSALFVLLCCLASWGVVYVIKGSTTPRMPLPTDFDSYSVTIAAGIGFLTVLVAVALKRLVAVIYPRMQRIDKKVSWILSATFFGVVLGLIYLLGGESIQFSGEAGVSTLFANRLVYPASVFAGLLLLKLLATTWSLATGYRGGMVFPSIYMASALSLAVCAIFALSGTAAVGATIGGTSGILISMTSPIVGIVLIFSLFPLKLVVVMIAGAAGAMAGQRVFKKMLAPPVSK